MTITRETLLSMLRRFVQQRPGFEPANYAGYVAGYRADNRMVQRQLHDARLLLSAVDGSSMPVETLIEGFRAFSGRLTLEARPDGKHALDYCAGQYYCTEYRAAVCAVLAAALWSYHRDDYAAAARGQESPGDAIRRRFRERFGRGVARRWFS